MVAQAQNPALNFFTTAVIDSEFKDISLSDYNGRYLVFFWYPADFTLSCSNEIIAFSNRMSEFSNLNTAFIAVSADSEYSHLAWMNVPRTLGGLGRNIEFPILADTTKRIARDYGVLIENRGIALRGLFIIDTNSIVRHITMKQ